MICSWLSSEIGTSFQIVGGLDLVQERDTQLEALVGVSPYETCSLADRLDIMAKGFLALRDSHEKHVAKFET